MVKVRERRHACGWRTGESHHNAEYTDHEIELARQLRAGGMSVSEVARKLGMSKGYASRVLSHMARR